MTYANSKYVKSLVALYPKFHLFIQQDAKVLWSIWIHVLAIENSKQKYQKMKTRRRYAHRQDAVMGVKR